MVKKTDKATPWSQLQPSQVDVMTCDWLDHYERSLGLTRKRKCSTWSVAQGQGFESLGGAVVHLILPQSSASVSSADWYETSQSGIAKQSEPLGVHNNLASRLRTNMEYQ